MCAARKLSTCGAIRNKQTDDPWEKDTMVIVFSATKGLAAMTLAIAHSRGWLDYEERMCKYWPEFAPQGKERITVRQLLAHQAGLYAQPGPRQDQFVRLTRSWRLSRFCRSGRRHRLRVCGERDGDALTGNPRDVALRDVLYSAIPARVVFK